MLRLLLLRHAKSSWDDPAVADEQRPLTKRGRRAADSMGRRIAELGLVPELVLCSPAVRARETLTLARPHWSPAPRERTEPGIYHAIDDDYLAVVRAAAPARCLMLVGHNPAMEETVELLATAAVTFPTAALAVIDFEIDAWSDVAPGQGKLAAFLTPE